MVQFIRTWIVVICVFFILFLAYAIFSPIVNNTFGNMAESAIYNGQQASGANGDQSSYYASLYSSKVMVVGFFNLFFYVMAEILLAYGVLNSLRRENDNYYQ
jgi:hypothetical protein